jgi:hypothetical protein
MKNNQLNAMLLGLVFLSTVWSVILILEFNLSMHKIRNLQSSPEVAAASTAQSVMQALLNDTLEYAKTSKNPDIIRIVQGVTGGRAMPAAPAPAPKPAK